MCNLRLFVCHETVWHNIMSVPHGFWASGTFIDAMPVLQILESLPVPDTSQFNYWKGDYEAIVQELDQIDWEIEMNSKDTYEMWEFIKNKVHEMCLKYVPIRVKGTKTKRKKQLVIQGNIEAH